MSIEAAPGSAERSMVGGRRVSLALAAPVVLLCGGVGVALGLIWPLHTWMSVGGEVYETRDKPAAVNAVASSASTDAHIRNEISETDSLENSPAPVMENTSAHSGEVLSQVAASQVATAPSRRKGEKAGSAPKKAKQRWDRENREPNVASHGARRRPERERNEPERRERPRPLISQIPVVGPVFGLFLP
jgi:hypothetical protein